MLTTIKNDFLFYTENNIIDSNCGDITFYNPYSTRVQINNGLRLSAFQSFTFNANQNELNTTQYSFRFIKPFTVGSQGVVVIRKFYQNMKNLQRFNVETLNYTQNNFIDSNCADITFINKGTNKVTINSGLILFAGQSLNLRANPGEIDRTKYNFNFDNGAGTNSIVILRKKYI